MASKSGRGQKRNSGSRETRDRRSVSRGNTIHRATTRHLDDQLFDEPWHGSSDEDEDVYPIEDDQLFPPGPVVRMVQGQEVGHDYITPERRDFNDEIKLTGRRRQSLLNLANQMEQENADFRADFGYNRISHGKTELPREVTRQIAEFAAPNYISDLTKTNAGEPSKRVGRLTRDKDGNKVVKREKSPRKKGGRRTRRRRKSRRMRKRSRKSRKSRRKSRKSRRTRRKR